MTNQIINTNNLTKIYKLYRNKKDRLLEAFTFGLKKYHNDFYALKNLSFSINRGETVGIIGKNGSGKSTLLKILTGVLSQTEGNYSVKGNVSSLLELGAGFNSELTGMENIFFNGLITGYSKSLMKKRVSQIVDFADIGDYIYQPVKTYSSGMFVRLAFSVAINVDPDILIVDEALSVGDIAFQMKCFDKFNKFKEQGKTILFVTHALDHVLQYCDRVIVLNNGVMEFDGQPKTGIDIYKKIMVNSMDKDVRSLVEKSKTTKVQINKDTTRYGDDTVTIKDCQILDSNHNVSDKFINNDDYYVKFRVKFNKRVEKPIFAFTVKDPKGNEITGTNSMYEQKEIGSFDAGSEVTVEFKQKMNLKSGGYALSLGCVSFSNGDFTVHERLYDVILFDVLSSKNFVGYYDPNSSIKVIKEC